MDSSQLYFFCIMSNRNICSDSGRTINQNKATDRRRAMNIKQELKKRVGFMDQIRLNDLEIDPLTIKAIMINEVVPADTAGDFYGEPDADYLKTTISLFQKAGIEVNNIQDILQKGIYITNAVKTPKSDY